MGGCGDFLHQVAIRSLVSINGLLIFFGLIMLGLSTWLMKSSLSNLVASHGMLIYFFGSGVIVIIMGALGIISSCRPSNRKKVKIAYLSSTVALLCIVLLGTRWCFSESDVLGNILNTGSYEGMSSPRGLSTLHWLHFQLVGLYDEGTCSGGEEMTRSPLSFKPVTCTNAGIQSGLNYLLNDRNLDTTDAFEIYTTCLNDTVYTPDGQDPDAASQVWCHCEENAVKLTRRSILGLAWIGVALTVLQTGTILGTMILLWETIAKCTLLVANAAMLVLGLFTIGSCIWAVQDTMVSTVTPHTTLAYVLISCVVVCLVAVLGMCAARRPSSRKGTQIGYLVVLVAMIVMQVYVGFLYFQEIGLYLSALDHQYNSYRTLSPAETDVIGNISHQVSDLYDHGYCTGGETNTTTLPITFSPVTCLERSINVVFTKLTGNESLRTEVGLTRWHNCLTFLDQPKKNAPAAAQIFCLTEMQIYDLIEDYSVPVKRFLIIMCLLELVLVFSTILLIRRPRVNETESVRSFNNEDGASLQVLSSSVVPGNGRSQGLLSPHRAPSESTSFGRVTNPVPQSGANRAPSPSSSFGRVTNLAPQRRALSESSSFGRVTSPAPQPAASSLQSPLNALTPLDNDLGSFSNNMDNSVDNNPFSEEADTDTASPPPPTGSWFRRK